MIKAQKGFSLIEVLVSLSMMGLVIANMLPAFAFQMRINNQSEIRTAAMEVGQRVVDELRFVSPTTMPASGAGTAQNLTVDGKTFTVTPHYCVRTQYCTSTSARHVTVRVVHNGTQIYETETVFTNFQ